MLASEYKDVWRVSMPSFPFFALIPANSILSDSFLSFFFSYLIYISYLDGVFSLVGQFFH